MNDKEFADTLIIALIPIRQMFKSGNSVPVERVTITAKQWERVENIIAERAK